MSVADVKLPSARYSIWRRALERPGLAVPSLYALSTSIGMLFYWVYFNELGIDILQYVDPSDLLMASFRQPVVWLIVLGSIIAVQLDNFCSARFGRRERSRWIAWYGSASYRRMNVLVGVLLVIIFIVMWAQISADRVISVHSQPVQLVFSEDATTVDGKLIGTSNRFIFLRDPLTGAHHAYPFEALRSIQFAAASDQAQVDEPAQSAATEIEADADE